MAKYNTVESWASRLGFVVEKAQDGYIWHASDETALNFCPSAEEVVEKVLRRIREDWGGEG
jgi:hypothetical protein